MEAPRISVTLEGPPEVVGRLMRAMAQALTADPADEAIVDAPPGPLLLTFAQAVARCGRGGKGRVRALLAEGKLRNHGTPRGIMIDPKELEQAIRG